MSIPSLAVWKLASCDGCQLALLDREDELLRLAGRVRIAHFLEASSAIEPGPYDVSLVEGSVTTEADRRRVHQIRAESAALVTIGACATAGGIQALRNLADVDEFRSVVYARPEYVSALSTSTPVAAHVPVDFELHGCPIDGGQLVGLLTALLAGRRPTLPAYSVCMECKRRGTACLLVAGEIPCLGPVTRAGCGALCPTYGRGCFGCFGPSDSANLPALTARLREAGMSGADIARRLRTFTVGAPEFARAATGEDARSAAEDARPAAAEAAPSAATAEGGVG